MVDSTTSFLGLTKPEIGGSENDCGDKWNANLDAIDTALNDTWKKTYAGNPNGFVAGDYAGQYLYDTMNQKEWRCKTAGSAAAAVWRETGGLPTGIKQPFTHIATAPPDWTVDTASALNNAAIRLVTSAPGANNGGSLDFSTAFAAGRNTGSYTLALADVPADPHAHGAGSLVDTAAANGISSGQIIGLNGTGSSAPGSPPYGTPSNSHNLSITRPGANGAVTGTTASYAGGGGGGGHLHPEASFAVKYADSCICVHN